MTIEQLGEQMQYLCDRFHFVCVTYQDRLFEVEASEARDGKTIGFRTAGNQCFAAAMAAAVACCSTQEPHTDEEVRCER